MNVRFPDSATLAGIFQQQAEKYPDREFLVYPDVRSRYTYAEFNERANNLAKGLLAIGISKGDHIGLWAPNVPDWVTFMFAVARVGTVLVPVNISYKAAELRYVLKHSDMKALATSAGFKDVDYIETIYELEPLFREQAPGALQSEAYPLLRNLFFMGEEDHPGMRTISELFSLGEGVGDEVLADAIADQNGDEVTNMQFTSGTTGFPKGVMLTHKNILNNAYYLSKGWSFSEKDRLCLAVPLFHCFGITVGVIACMVHGSAAVILETFNPTDTLRAIEDEKCTALHGVPTMFIAMLAHPEFSTFDLSTLRTGAVGGSPCPMETMKRIISEMHLSELTSAFGLTEAAPGVTQTRKNDSVERRVTSVGVPLEGVEVKIAEPETGETLGDNEPGELCCRGYNVMKGYYKMPEATAQAVDADGWLHTGDQAVRDEEGYYRITGRIKDMIIQGGENISAREIEELLITMPGIQDAQVIGVPHSKLGEIPGAAVILEKGAEVTAKNLRDFCKAHIARFKIPRHVFFVDSFPLTASGKVQKFKLREMARERLGIERDTFE